MIKSKLLFAILSSTFAFASCAKDDKKAENVAKTTETAATDTAVPGDQAAVTPVTPDTAEPDTAEADTAEAAAPLASDASREVVAEQAIAMFAQLNKIVQATKTDCPKMATDVKAFVEKSKPIMEAAEKFEKNPEDKKWFDDTHGEKVTATMTEMMGNMSECMSDPAVQAAFESMSAK